MQPTPIKAGQFRTGQLVHFQVCFECLQRGDLSYCYAGVGSLGLVCARLLVEKAACYSRPSLVKSLFLCMLNITWTDFFFPPYFLKLGFLLPFMLIGRTYLCVSYIT